MRECSIEGCARTHYGRSYCHMHWRRWKRHGDPMGGGRRYDNMTVEERFWARVDKDSSCWIWNGSLNHKGYGTFGLDKKGVLAHRMSYKFSYGEIPAGMQVDHICFNRTCVRPDHLRLVTNKQNMEHRQGATRISKSGVRGVILVKGKWMAVVTHYGKHYNYGYYESIEEADLAAQAGRMELFTHDSSPTEITQGVDDGQGNGF